MKFEITKFLFFIVPGITFILGLIVQHYFDLYKNKIPKIRYQIRKSFLGASEADEIFGKVQILYNNIHVENLYLCTIDFQNSSNHDFTNLKITVWSDIESLILVSNAQKQNTIKRLEFTSEYKSDLANVTNDNFNYVYQRRIYEVPILNRDDKIAFSCLTTNFNRKEPNIYLDCQHEGLKLVPNFIQPKLFWGERQDISALWGLFLAALLLIPLGFYIPWKTALITISFILGAFCIVPGALFLKTVNFIKKLFR